MSHASNMASAIEMWLENAIYSDEANDLTKLEVISMIYELEKTKVSQMVDRFRADVNAGSQWGTWKEEE